MILSYRKRGQRGYWIRVPNIDKIDIEIDEEFVPHVMADTQLGHIDLDLGRYQVRITDKEEK